MCREAGEGRKNCSLEHPSFENENNNRNAVNYCDTGLESEVATRWDIQKYAREAYNLGVRYIGRCCGFEPYHIRAIAEELAPERGFLPPASEKHGSWGSGLDMHTKPWVRARFCGEGSAGHHENSKSEEVRQLHREFLRAGSNVMQTFTFYASEDKLENRGNYVLEKISGQKVSEAACDIARQVADEGDALVAGGVSQTPSYLSCKSETEVKKIFLQQLEVFMKKNVDFLIAEVKNNVEDKTNTRSTFSLPLAFKSTVWG
ncbi:hypothetical protein H8959_021969 [Pygathrix nigripes]